MQATCTVTPPGSSRSCGHFSAPDSRATYLFMAVATGLLRVARESLFSDLNNLGVYSLLRPELNPCFGFTEAEIAALLARNGRADRLDAVRDWYNGHVFGGEIVHNPWSVLGFLDAADARLRRGGARAQDGEIGEEDAGAGARGLVRIAGGSG